MRGAQPGAQARCLVGYLPSAMSLLDELITTSRVLDLNSCRSLCGIPASTTRKSDLIEALQLQGRCPHKRRAVLCHLMDKMTANSLRTWISSLRRAGFRVPDSKVMGRRRVAIMDAIMRWECPAGEYSPARGDEALDEARGQGASATGQADSAGEYRRREPVPWGRLTAHRAERHMRNPWAATMLEW